MKKGVLVLEDGRCFLGIGWGADGVQTGEVVFNTSMTGYQEILTDPSYYRQIVVMTTPHIGNTGINIEDNEADKIWVAGFVVRSLSPDVSNWRSRGNLQDYLQSRGVIGISDIATRALVRHIREHGVMRAAIAQGDAAEDVNALVQLAQQSPSMTNANLVDDVTCREPYHWVEHSDPAWYEQSFDEASDILIVAYDLGLKRNILRMLTDRGLRVSVVPATTPASDVLAMKPGGVFLSNGPGDPSAVSYMIDNVRGLLGKVPIFGICLGHQILALALGGKTEKMRFGHRGGNQPVKNLLTGKVEISVHNHGFTVAPDSEFEDVEITHINLNDQTIEGIRQEQLGVFSVQYHPEAAPGPHDSLYIFDEFVKRVKGGNVIPSSS